MRKPRVGLVLAGGAARGAYEAGVLAHVLERVVPETSIAVEIVCGTSVGALHACALAAQAERPREVAVQLTRMWSSLELGQILRPGLRELVSLLTGAFRRQSTALRAGLLDPRPLARMVGEAVRFDRVAANLAAGRLSALSVTATQVATGEPVVFVQGDVPLPPRPSAPGMRLEHATLTLAHALASAAVPLLFPPVELNGELYCDGGLRQLVPLSPALELGAEALLVISPRHAGRAAQGIRHARQHAVASPFYLLGKTLDALLLDRLDEDLDRLSHINAILRAGGRRYGPSFTGELGKAMEQPFHPPRAVEAVVIRASRDIGAMAADFVASRDFLGRSCQPAAQALRCLSELEGSRETDLVSYLLFDGNFARELLELGRADARAQHAELCALLSPAAQAEAAG